MWVSEMKLKFKLKVFLTVLAISAAFAGVAAWATGLNFWVLAAIAGLSAATAGAINSWTNVLVPTNLGGMRPGL